MNRLSIQPAALNFGPYVLAALLLLPSLWWIAADKSIWPFDPAWYGTGSLDLWFWLTHNPFRWVGLWFQTFRTKAPGIAWFGQFFIPFGRAAGSIEFGLLLSVWITQMGALVLACKTARKLWPNRLALHVLAPVALAAAPLFIGMTHQYFVEAQQLFAVTYFYWLAAHADSIGPKTLRAHLLLATGVALAAKITSPMYCLGPGLIVLAYLFFDRARGVDGPKTKLFFRFSLIFFLFTLGWYGKNLVRISNFMKAASSGAAALDYGKPRPFLEKMSFWLGATQEAFLMPAVLALLGGLLLLAMGLGARRFRKSAESPFGGPAPWIAAAGFTHAWGVLAVLSLNINEETRYLLPILPSIVFLALWILSAAPGGWAPGVLTVALLAQWGAVHRCALNLSNETPAATSRKAASMGISHWVTPCQRDASPKKETQRLVTQLAEKSRDQINLCGVDFPWLNADTLGFFSAQERLRRVYRVRYTSLGYAEKDSNKAWEKVLFYDSPYFISVEAARQPEPDFANRISLPILERVAADPKFTREPFPSDLGIVVYRNTSKLP